MALTQVRGLALTLHGEQGQDIGPQFAAHAFDLHAQRGAGHRGQAEQQAAECARRVAARSALRIHKG